MTLKSKFKRKAIKVLSLVLGIIIYFSIKYPLSYRDLILKYSTEYSLDPYLIASIINVESRYNSKATSNKSAKGLMQITSSTGQWLSELMGIEDFEDQDLYDPELNIQMGTWYIKKLLSDFDGNLDLALAAYNAGSGNVQKWLRDKEYSLDGRSLNKIPFKETDDYLKKIYKNYDVYRVLYKIQFKKEPMDHMRFLHDIKEIVLEKK